MTNAVDELDPKPLKNVMFSMMNHASHLKHDRLLFTEVSSLKPVARILSKDFESLKSSTKSWFSYVADHKDGPAFILKKNMSAYKSSLRAKDSIDTFDTSTGAQMLSSSKDNWPTLDRKSSDQSLHGSGESFSSLYVSNFPPGFTTEDLRALFTRFGDIISVVLKSRRVGFVNMAREEDAEAALDSMNGYTIPGTGSRLVVKPAARPSFIDQEHAHRSKSTALPIPPSDPFPAASSVPAPASSSSADVETLHERFTRLLNPRDDPVITSILTTADLESFIPVFMENEITVDMLPIMSASDLAEVGISKVGHRLRFQNAVKNYFQS